MKSFDEFRPEQIEEQIEQFARASSDESSGAQIVQALRGLYMHDASQLERIWQRLESHQTAQKTSQVPSEEKRWEKISFMENTLTDAPQQTLDASHRNRKKRPIFGLFGTLAAILVCTLLVGSLVFVFGALRQSHQTKTASHHPGNTSTSSPQHAKPLPAPRSRGNAAGLYIADDDTLYRLNQATGKTLWSFSLPGDPNAKGGPGFLAYALTTGDGVVYVGENDGGNSLPANQLYAFDALTGQKLWVLHLNVQALDFADGTLYAALDGDAIAAIDPDTGATIWKTQQPGYISKIVAVDQDVVYAFGPSDGQAPPLLVALHASSGKQLWTKTVTILQATGVSLANGVLYVAGSSAQTGTSFQDAPDYVQAYNASNGQVLWRSQSLSGLVGAAPAVANGHVYIGTNMSRLYVLNASNGHISWQIRPGGDVSGPIYIVNNTLYIAPTTIESQGAITNYYSQVAAYNATTGARQWSETVPNLFVSDVGGAAEGTGDGSFIVTGSAIYYLNLSPEVQLLNPATGNPIPGAHQPLLRTYGLAFMILTH